MNELMTRTKQFWAHKMRLLKFKLHKMWRGFKNLDAFQYTMIIILTLVAAFMMLPLIYIFNHAFKPYHELFLFPPNFIVRNPNLQNFTDLLSRTEQTFIPITRYLFNSIVVTLAATVGMIISSALAAYPLSKHKFPGRGIVFMTVIISLLFVFEVLQIPRYVVVQALGVMNTYWGHILPMIALPVGVFLLKQFMDQVPDELLEAAKIDGASEWKIFVRVVIPIVTPAMATVGILAFQETWRNLETSSLFMQNEAMRTLPFYLTTLTANLANAVAAQGAAAAAMLIMFVPNVVIFLIFQRKVIATMAHSGIK